MRPLKLTMSAFGPYAGVETIEFNALKGKNIFLITGPTGAGKTTVFDAISYALFGEASGSSRETDSLRSHFASPEIETFVELEFELRGETYKVKRSPKQEIKKARGEGTRVKESDGEITLPDGTVIARVTNVDNKITSILGISKSQFRQIVMLPQGEFRKLLEAESKEREVIFRKIFGTEAFKLVEQKLDNLEREYYRKIKEGGTKRETHIKHIQPGEDEVLTKLIHAEYLNVEEILVKTKEVLEIDEVKNKKLTEEIKTVKEQEELLQKTIIEGKEINNKLNAKEELQQAYNLQQMKEEETKKKDILLEKGRKSLQVSLIEESLLQRRKNLEAKQTEVKEAEENFQKAKEDVVTWENKVKEEEGKEPLRKSLSSEINSLKDKEEKVKSYEEKCINIKDLEKAAAEKKQVDENLKLTIKKEKQDIEDVTKTLLYLQSCETERAELSRDIDDKNKVIEILRELRTKTRQYVNHTKIHGEEKKAFEAFEKEYHLSKREYEVKEDLFLKAQAGILAKDLGEGEACPVCGSTYHPKKASMLKEVPTEEELKLAKEAYEGKNDERNEILQKLSGINGQIKASLTDLIETKEKMASTLGDEILSMSHETIITFVNAQGPKLKEELDTLVARRKELEAAISKKAPLNTELKKLQKDLEDKEQKLPAAEIAYTTAYGNLISEQKLLENIEGEIPEEIRSSVKLRQNLTTTESKLKKLEEAYKAAQEGTVNAKNKQATAAAKVEAAHKNLLGAQEEVKTCEENLHNQLKECGFADFEEYSRLKMKEAQIQLLDREIKGFYQKLQELKGGLERAIKETENVSLVEVEPLVKELEERKAQEKQFAEEEKHTYSRRLNNEKVLKEIKQINTEISKDEEKHAIISDIAKHAKGDNSERITFERYVLAAYFDEIITAANLRLNKMAGGRFVLKRKTEKGKGIKQDGLELEVFDNYTGKARHVKTLSGGESFKASLALALGLADVVQAYAGGISLDTMFVDEGFGTLDPESLDNAVQCLIDLQKGGRLVGIISHVPELKERIDVRLEITPAKEGSRATFVL